MKRKNLPAKNEMATIPQAPAKVAVAPSLPCSLKEAAQILTVGQKVTLQCSLTSLSEIPAVDNIQFSSGESDPYELVILGKPVLTDKMLEQTITSYRLGSHEFSKMQLKLGDKFFSIPSFKFEVKTVIAQQQNAEQGQPAQQPTPYPLIDPLKLSAPLWWWILWGAIVCAIGAYAFKKFSQWKKARDLKAQNLKDVKVHTPEELFTLALQKLESHEWHIKGEYKRFALDLTVIIKKAMGEKFSFPAEDMTTEEFLETLEKKHNKFYKQAENYLKNILQALDQIKFAKTETNSDACMSLMDIAKSIGRMMYRGDS